VRQAYGRIRNIDQYREYEKYSQHVMKEKEVSHKEGVEEGIEIGKEKGIEIGIEKGRIEESRSIALQMLADGEGEDKIVKYTKLTKLQIQELKESLDQ